MMGLILRSEFRKESLEPDSVGLGGHSKESEFCSKMEIHWRVWCREVTGSDLYF